MKVLSLMAKNLWAKKTLKDGVLQWLPLEIHMLDSVDVAKKLWHHWIPEGVKKNIINETANEANAEKLLIFLSAMHDLGKATPVFQSKKTHPYCLEADEAIKDRLIAAGLPMKSREDFASGNKTPHALAAQVLLEKAGCNRSVAAIIGAHHGKPPTYDVINTAAVEAYAFNYNLEEEDEGPWQMVQQELIDFALAHSCFADLQYLPEVGMAAQVLLSGILVMTDWIASNESYFPYISLEKVLAGAELKNRTRDAWLKLNLPVPWAAGNLWMSADLYQKRFSEGDRVFEPREFQTVAADTAAEIKKPGIMVLEAPMGSGKTEAALACSEIFASKSNRAGIYFALPTQATADGIFPRLASWIKKLAEFGGYSIQLAHGKAQFNEEFQALKSLKGSTNVGIDMESDGSLIVHEWFEGQKKTLLADFVVGTIDQLLLAALKQKHVMLRHLGLASKVVIVDECHAYDAYMGQYLYRVLNWLGAYNVPVLILSATLPVQKRQAVIDAYLNKNSSAARQNNPFAAKAPEPPVTEPSWDQCLDYPLITYTDGAEVKQKTIVKNGISREVSLCFLQEAELVKKLENLLTDGGCAGVITNIVKRAQQFAQILRVHFGEDVVRLLHSRFLAQDRVEKEKILLAELGKSGHAQARPRKRIVVGTQVLEQSLDIDFDVLITDLCPMDLLLQRIGRLHRHQRRRPVKLSTARAFLLGCDSDDFEAGAKNIYGEYLLMRTKALLPQQSILIPDSIPELVQKTYDVNVALDPEPAGYKQAEEKQNTLIASKETRAKSFRIGPVWTGKNQNLVNWLDTDVSSQQGEAAVRDTDEAVEVLLVQQKEAGKIIILSGADTNREVTLFTVPDDDTAKMLACQKILLPRILCVPWMIDRTINELEEKTHSTFGEWQKSPWLKGELVLALNEQYRADLCGYRLTYSKADGLLYGKEEDYGA